MATGDDATAGGMAIVPGTTMANTIDTELTKTRDYIANGHTHWKPALGALPVAKGGTGGTTAAAARTALGAAAAADVQTTPGAGKIPRWDGNGILASEGPPVFSNQVANKAYVDTRVASVDLSSRVAKTGDTMTGHLYLPNSTAASSGYTIAYINGDGRVSRGASSERYKDDITPINPAVLGDIFPQLHTFTMKDDPGHMERVGYIAERLAESPDLERFVVYAREPVFEDELDEDGNVIGYRVIGTRRARDVDGNFICESIDFIALLLAQVAQLRAELDEVRR